MDTNQATIDYDFSHVGTAGRPGYHGTRRDDGTVIFPGGSSGEMGEAKPDDRDCRDYPVSGTLTLNTAISVGEDNES